MPVANCGTYRGRLAASIADFADGGPILRSWRGFGTRFEQNNEIVGTSLVKSIHLIIDRFIYLADVRSDPSGGTLSSREQAPWETSPRPYLIQRTVSRAFVSILGEIIVPRIAHRDTLAMGGSVWGTVVQG